MPLISRTTRNLARPVSSRNGFSMRNNNYMQFKSMNMKPTLCFNTNTTLGVNSLNQGFQNRSVHLTQAEIKIKMKEQHEELKELEQCQENGDAQRAKDIINEMLSKDKIPLPQAFDFTVAAILKQRDIDGAIQFIDLMDDYDLTLEDNIWDKILDYYYQRLDMEGYDNAVHKMILRAYDPSIDVFNKSLRLMLAIGEARQFWDLYERMRMCEAETLVNEETKEIIAQAEKEGLKKPKIHLTWRMD
eukprot:gb/GECH01004071.1/.p1 GENE.gb/GECH01004071.1/~~gb/GECH01004071.1/.p1  ORF type:complete len:245 (+),score=42.82 gb/GECH01004071.1/:1-735(+)